MSIDEAIKDLKECDGWQIAEWLEELKFLRTAKETMYREIYNQALEDLKFNLEEEKKTYAYNGYSLDTDKWLDNYLKSKLG